MRAVPPHSIGCARPVVATRSGCSMRCAKCGSENGPSNKFCCSAVRRWMPFARLAAHCRAGVRFCQNCGSAWARHHPPHRLPGARIRHAGPPVAPQPAPAVEARGRAAYRRLRTSRPPMRRLRPLHRVPTRFRLRHTCVYAATCRAVARAYPRHRRPRFRSRRPCSTKGCGRASLPPSSTPSCWDPDSVSAGELRRRPTLEGDKFGVPMRFVRSSSSWWPIWSTLSCSRPAVAR